MQGEVSPESMGKTAPSAVGSPPDVKPATSATTWEHCRTKSAKAVLRKAVRAIERVEIGKSKRRSRLKLLDGYWTHFAGTGNPGDTADLVAVRFSDRSISAVRAINALSGI